MELNRQKYTLEHSLVCKMTHVCCKLFYRNRIYSLFVQFIYITGCRPVFQKCDGRRSNPLDVIVSFTMADREPDLDTSHRSYKIHTKNVTCTCLTRGFSPEAAKYYVVTTGFITGTSRWLCIIIIIHQTSIFCKQFNVRCSLLVATQKIMQVLIYLL